MNCAATSGSGSGRESGPDALWAGLEQESDPWHRPQGLYGVVTGGSEPARPPATKTGLPLEATGVSSTAHGPRAQATAWTAALLCADVVRTGNRVRREELGRPALSDGIEHCGAGYPRVSTVLPPIGRKT